MNQKRIKLKINGQEVEARPGLTVLECARQNNIFIPSLCELEGLTAFAGCRLCLVEIKGQPSLVPACQNIVEEGMEVVTSSEQLENLRRSIFELILSEHPYFCLLCSEKSTCEELKITLAKAEEPGGCIFCPKDGQCQLQKVAEYLKIKTQSYEYKDRGETLWTRDPFITHNPNLCVLCGRCVRVCEEIRGEGVLSFVYRGLQTSIGTFFNQTLLEADCSFCGACVDVCPTAAFMEKGLTAARGQKLKRVRFVCPLCSSGCQLEAEFLESGLIRKISPVSEDKPAFESGCARGRFGLRELLNDSKDNLKALIKTEGGQVEISDREAIRKAASAIRAFRPDEIAFVLSGEFYLNKILSFLEIARACGASQVFWLYPENFLTRIKQFSDKEQVNLIKFLSDWASLPEAGCYLIIDSDPKEEEPVFWLELNQRIRRGSEMIVLDSAPSRLQRSARVRLQCQPGQEYLVLLAILKLVNEELGVSFYPGFNKLVGDLGRLSIPEVERASGIEIESLKKTAELLLGHPPSVIVFGERFLRQEHWAESLRVLWNLALRLEAVLMPISSRINELVIPELVGKYSLRIEPDLNLLEQEIKEQKIRMLYLLGDLPLEIKPEFLLVQNVFKTGLALKADIFLPDSSGFEERGYLVDFAGKIKINPGQKNGDNRSSEKLFGLLAEELGLKLEIGKEAQAEELQKKVLTEIFYKNENGKKEPKKKYLMIKEDLELWLSQNLKLGRNNHEELTIIIQSNQDHYGGIAFSEISPAFRQIRNPRSLRLNPEDADRWLLEEGEEVEVITELGNFEATVKIDSGLKPGVASIRPYLNNSFWLNCFSAGLIKGKIIKKVEQKDE
ncbi:MAG: 2Fe-2S iron-sulfur cluster-binding protein [Candidatus Saccharicenans sp.]